MFSYNAFGSQVSFHPLKISGVRVAIVLPKMKVRYWPFCKSRYNNGCGETLIYKLSIIILSSLVTTYSSHLRSSMSTCLVVDVIPSHYIILSTSYRGPHCEDELGIKCLPE